MMTQRDAEKLNDLQTRSNFLNQKLSSLWQQFHAECFIGTNESRAKLQSDIHDTADTLMDVMAQAARLQGF